VSGVGQALPPANAFQQCYQCETRMIGVKSLLADRLWPNVILAAGKTDWKRLESLQDVDIRRAAKSDPDAAPVVSNQWFQQARLWDRSAPPKRTPDRLEAVQKAK
jgi:hypothetical protein